MKTCHNMNIIVHTAGGYKYSLNDKSEIPNNTLANIKISLLLNSSYKKECWCFTYQYIICFSRLNENIFSGDVDYFLWHGTISAYKHIKIWGVRFQIINGCVTRNNLDDISNQGYLWDIPLLKELLYTVNQVNLLLSTYPTMSGLMNLIIISP